MIPSDHFVKFYNEVFKYLEKQGPAAVAEYYSAISRHQEMHCLKYFQEHGLQGMYDYWKKIEVEENCDCDSVLDPGKSYKFIMHGCPSLSKVLDNDAGASEIYCRHCPGWTLPLMTKAGYYCVFDMIGLEIPRCVFAVFTKREDAENYRRKALLRHRGGEQQLVVCNFQENENNF